jgi:hypothetical protein
MATKKLITENQTIVYYSDTDGINKMHNWDGPAFIPKGSMKLAEYYIYGIKYSKDDWLDRKRDGNGLPWYKTAIGKNTGARV